MKNDCIKYGICTVVAWNLFIMFLSYMSFLFHNPALYDELFDTTFDACMFSFFIVLWSVAWYCVGYHGRKEFLLGRALFREEHSSLENNVADRLFTFDYVAKYSKILLRVALVSIPAYIVMSVDGKLSSGNLIILALLAIASVLCFCVYKRASAKSVLP